MEDARNVLARQAAEAAARASYGRLLALLASRSRDITAAEDALSEAFAAALRVWPDQGVPDRPEAWLLTAARRNLGHAARAQGVRTAATGMLDVAYEEAAARESPDFPDERLKLLFVCSHPAIDETIRTPLMLQTVLGLDAAAIGAAFLVAPATMGQRLVRAKAKIRDAGLSFDPPDRSVLPERITDVLAAVYAAFGTGWDGVGGAETGGRGLTDEAIYLGRLACGLLPEEPEAKGLLALMLYCDARRDARRTPDGGFVPLSGQDAKLWRRDLIIEAEGLLTSASRAGRFGRFQCEAAIQSVHCQRAFTGLTNWTALRQLYDMLAVHSPTLGVLVSRAAVTAEAEDALSALARLDALPADRVEPYQPFWATRARVLSLLGRKAESDESLRRAIALTAEPAIRAFLAAGLSGDP